MMLQSQEPSGKKVFISYLDDNNIQRDTYVYLLEQNDNFVKFRTKTNIITLPFSRVIKIKEELYFGVRV